ncbi:MAG TPA: glycosyltransferase family 9 protein [Tepidisphaeraceae bacterium]|nr:glycosyltransferase family 9 protein [Tepidisphaeraceae bacterium]
MQRDSHAQRIQLLAAVTLRRNILIFHAGGLGDFVLSWPLGIALGRLYPASRVIYVTQPSKGALAAAAIGLDWQNIESGWPALYGDNGVVLDEKCGRTLAGAHSIFTFMAAAGDSWCANVNRLSPEAPIVALRLKPPSGFTGHVSGHLLGQLAGVPVVRAAVEQILTSVGKNGLRGSRPAGNASPAIVHPGSGGREKCWPVAKFVALVERLGKGGQQVKIVLGEVELERLSREEIRQLESAAPLVQPADYLGLMNELSNAANFIGNDSGPGHLAGLLGVPSLILFGPSDPAVWKPLGPRVQVIRSSHLEELPVDEVYSAAARL